MLIEEDYFVIKHHIRKHHNKLVINKCSVEAEMGDRARAKWAEKLEGC